ncbi:MAG: hypothetical protein M5U08_10665 [Burkholderiales bacterium]|nr:hypothetical protein [Burkholderiales bacterium]
MRRRAAIDSSFQLCLWDELGRIADERDGSFAAGAAPAADPRPTLRRTEAMETPQETPSAVTR